MQPGQLRRAQGPRGAHAGIPGQICEAGVGIRQEPFCGLEVGMLAQVHVLFNQVALGTGPLMNRGHVSPSFCGA